VKQKGMELLSARTIIGTNRIDSLFSTDLNIINWSKKVLEDPFQYLEIYFQRNLSEAAFSADKRRFGWVLRQKREDRQEMAMFSVFLGSDMIIPLL